MSFKRNENWGGPDGYELQEQIEQMKAQIEQLEASQFPAAGVDISIERDGPGGLITRINGRPVTRNERGLIVKIQ